MSPVKWLEREELSFESPALVQVNLKSADRSWFAAGVTAV